MERGASRGPQVLAYVHPAVGRGKGAGVAPSNAGLVSLAVQDTDRPGLPVEVLRLQGEGLGDAQTAR